MSEAARETQVLVVAGGGTGGHVFPGIAIAEELVARDACREVVFVGTARGVEARAVPAAGFELHCLRVRGLLGKGRAEQLRGLALVAGALVAAARLLRRRRARLVIGVGGYASGPVVAAAFLLGVPCLIQEQNVLPGVTNRLLAYVADAVALPFAASRAHIAGRGVVTGNPVRSGFVPTPLPPLGAGPRRLLVFGGSQGARALNAAVLAALPALAAGAHALAVDHQCAAAEVDALRAAYAAHEIAAEVAPFFTDMARRYRRAHLVLARAGASTVAELTASGRPSVLVPYPHASHNHQEHNARLLERAGAARVVLERDLDGARLAERLEALLDDGAALTAMAAAAARLGRPEAARRVADIAESLLATDARRVVA